MAYHVDHVSQWVLRLGDGTEVSHARMQRGLDRVWPYVAELFDDSWLDPALIDRTVRRPAELTARGHHEHDRAGDQRGDPDRARASTSVPGGGRFGLHTEDFGYLLAEFQHLARSHPGATW